MLSQRHSAQWRPLAAIERIKSDQWRFCIVRCAKIKSVHASYARHSKNWKKIRIRKSLNLLPKSSRHSPYQDALVSSGLEGGCSENANAYHAMQVRVTPPQQLRSNSQAAIICISWLAMNNICLISFGKQFASFFRVSKNSAQVYIFLVENLLPDFDLS